MCGSESIPGFDIGVVLGAKFLQDVEGGHTHEGMRWELGGDDPVGRSGNEG
jgi:hypothetical protein